MKPAGARLSLAFALATPTAAGAHVAVQSVALLSGAIQPWATMDSAALLAASALWIAQGARATDLKVYLLASTGLMVGTAVGLAAPRAASPSFSYLIALLVALAVCAARRPRQWIWVLMLSMVAAMAGLCAGSDAAGGVLDSITFSGGTFAGGLIALLSVGVALERQSNRIVAVATRVMGSWVAALSAMMLVFSWRG